MTKKLQENQSISEHNHRPKPVFHTRFNPPHDPGLATGDESHVRQSEKAACDINVIMDRYTKTGILPHMNHNAPRYLDCSGLDYKKSLDIVRNAQEMFMDLPAKTRQRFNHDPAQFLDFFNDPKNAEEAIKLGLAEKPELTEKQLLKKVVKNTEKELDKSGNSAHT